MLNCVHYCENCRVACAESVCPGCGKKRLRFVDGSDWCFVTQQSESLNTYFKNELEKAGEEAVVMPWMSALDTKRAVRASSSKLFVRYDGLEAATRLVREYFSEITENLRKRLLDNFGEFSIDLPVEKRARKKLKIAEDTDIFDYCGDIIYEAESISDTGVTEGAEEGHILLALNASATLYINSATFHIVALEKRVK